MNRLFLLPLIYMLALSCSTPLIHEPRTAMNEWWEMRIVSLTLGPDQYNTAKGYWRPRAGRRFVWARVVVTNRLKTKQQFEFARLKIRVGEDGFKPVMVDMGAPVSLQANTAPLLEAGESIERIVIYSLPDGTKPESIYFESDVQRQRLTISI